MSPDVRRVGPDAAEAVHAVVHAAFAGRPVLDPPADALAEEPATLAAALAPARGLLAEIDGRPVGAALLDPVGPTLYLRRVGVHPDAQDHGVAHALVAAAHEAGAGFTELAVLAREELPATIGFWESLGFRTCSRATPYVELRRPLPTAYDVPDADAMRGLGERLGALLVPGDLVVLSGELGAGKTTFTQGLGAGLGVRGQVTSPTFVIARVHPSLVGGAGLVHVDAYRIGGLEELDDLDLDTSLDGAVTVVEWGTGLAEGLAEHRLEVEISRSVGAETSRDGLDPRVVRLHRR
ncbi:tRNA (adenosine(37)-N6)-threonylcarbamoyltransferase complex ATPase subunit type 1 TsaE [Nocardioides sp. LHG3406-4]|uniref:tRNA (adenosine(37)-N6)-threonylcarbamoyltransferase complex ATPase subunit type 1 TsaE n=1 Tax=Nocardioides sp. LHG3406-4 TaxID=2804575 RepID=UPI003CF1BC13